MASVLLSGFRFPSLEEFTFFKNCLKNVMLVDTRQSYYVWGLHGFNKITDFWYVTPCILVNMYYPVR